MTRNRYGGGTSDQKIIDLASRQVTQSLPPWDSPITTPASLKELGVHTDWTALATCTIENDTENYQTAEVLTTPAVKITVEPGAAFVPFIAVKDFASTDISAYDHLEVKFYIDPDQDNIDYMDSLFLRQYDVPNAYRNNLIWNHPNHERDGITGWNHFQGTLNSGNLGGAFDDTQLDRFYISGTPSQVLYFTNGSDEIVAGSKIEGKTSGATLSTYGIHLVAGSWAAGTAEGYITGKLTGTFQQEDLVHEGGSVTIAQLQYEHLRFTLGDTYEIQEGDSILGETSGTTATIEKIVITAGSYVGGDAMGLLMVSSPSAAFQAENVTIDGNVGAAHIEGDSTFNTVKIPGSQLEFTLDLINMRTGFDTPGISLRFDDGLDGAYDAGVYLASKGLKAYFCAITDKIGTTGYMTWEQLKNLERMGHTIVSHGSGGTTFAGASTTKEMESAIFDSRNTLLNQGFSDGVYCLAPSGGFWGDYAEDNLKEFNLIWLMTKNSSSGTQDASSMFDPQKMHGVLTNDTTGAVTAFGIQTRVAATVDNAILDAIASKSVLTLYWHEPAIAQFQTDIDALAARVDSGTIKNYSITDVLHGNA